MSNDWTAVNNESERNLEQMIVAKFTLNTRNFLETLRKYGTISGAMDQIRTRYRPNTSQHFYRRTWLDRDDEWRHFPLNRLLILLPSMSKGESPALCMYLKCLLLAASRRATNQHQETPSAPIHFQAAFICTAFELLVLDGGSTGNSTAPFIIRSHQTSKNCKPKNETRRNTV